MSDFDVQRDIAQVAAWLDDLARRDTAVENITAMGSRAVEPLARYLERGPQPISQPRALAVEMLGRLHDARVPELLRGLLRAHPLHDLPTELIESEFRVKDAAIKAMATQRNASENDISWAIQSERLPSAVRAAGALRMVNLLPTVVELLTDDVLASPTESAIRALLPESIKAVLTATQTWLEPAKDTPRTRLALIRAFRWLAATGASVSENLTDQALDHSCSMVRSAAALNVRDIAHAPILVALLHGALNREPILASACRDKLEEAGQALIEPALDALHASVESDIYDNTHSADIWGRYWLLTCLLQLTRRDVAALHRVMVVVSEDEIVVGLHRWASPSAISLKELIHHPDSQIRAAAASAVKRLDPVESVEWLADRLGDSDRDVRRQAYITLRHRIHARYVSLNFTDIPLLAWCFHPLKCVGLLMMSQRK